MIYKTGPEVGYELGVDSCDSKCDNQSTSVPLFPLPYFTIPPKPPSHSGRVNHRYVCLREQLQQCNRTIHSLNELYISPCSINTSNRRHIRGTGNCVFYNRGRVFGNHLYTSNDQQILSVSHHDVLASATTSRTARMLSNVFTAVRRSPLGSHLKEFSSVSGVDGDYEESQFISSLDFSLPSSYSSTSLPGGTVAIPIVADKVSLPSPESGVSSIDMQSVLPPTVAHLYSNPANLLKHPDDVDVEKMKKPKVFGTQEEYRKLIARLFRANMTDFTTTPGCVNGVFGVDKDDGASIRLIIDATNLNELMIESPPIKLPNPSHLAALSSSGQFYTMKCDLKDYYHQIQLPSHLRSFFCLPPIKLKHLVQVLPDIDVGKFTDVQDGEQLIYPMLASLPMGWSHSVFIAQCIHEHVLYTLHPVLNPTDNIMVHQSLLPDRLLHLIYIDDLGLLGTCRLAMEKMKCRIEEAYSAVGMRVNVKKSVLPTMEPVKLLGIMVDGQRTVLSQICTI